MGGGGVQFYKLLGFYMIHIIFPHAATSVKLLERVRWPAF